MKNLSLLWLAIFGIAIIAGILFFWLNKGQNDKKTLWYVALFALLGTIFGMFSYLFASENFMDWQPSSVYILAQSLFSSAAIFHVWYLYNRCFWSVRNTTLHNEDAFLKEFIFSVFVACITVLFFILPIVVLSDKTLFLYNKTFIALPLCFIVPFLSLKSYDFFAQIPKKEYNIQWLYPQNAPLDPNRWIWENKVWVDFEIVNSLVEEGKWRAPKAKFGIEVPREQSIENIFRLGLREYHRRSPSVHVQDLGNEPSQSIDFWWLFYIKWVWNRPASWFRSRRYIDPSDSTTQNELKHGDILVAKRKTF